MSFMTHDKRGGHVKLGNAATVRSGLVLSRKQAKEAAMFSSKMTSSALLSVRKVRMQDLQRVLQALTKLISRVYPRHVLRHSMKSWKARRKLPALLAASLLKL